MIITGVNSKITPKFLKLGESKKLKDHGHCHTHVEGWVTQIK